MAKYFIIVVLRKCAVVMTTDYMLATHEKINNFIIRDHRKSSLSDWSVKSWKCFHLFS